MSTRILIVDDAAFMRHMIKNILKDMGAEVVGEAADGNEACEKYDELKPDLVTMDLIMPKKGGLDALKDIREKDPDAKVIVISAIDQRQPLMDALKLGASDYVVKPFDKDRVEDAINRVMAG
ncbi:MAG: response regulator [Planctomycetota bacterium]|nr:response regulator [Planctomycetota bacterium]